MNQQAAATALLQAAPTSGQRQGSVAGADRPDVRERAPGVRELTAKTLLKCMQIDPAQRYENALALVHSLERNLDLLDRPQKDTEPVTKPTDQSGPTPLLMDGQSNEKHL